MEKWRAEVFAYSWYIHRPAVDVVELSIRTGPTLSPSGGRYQSRDSDRLDPMIQTGSQDISKRAKAQLRTWTHPSETPSRFAITLSIWTSSVRLTSCTPSRAFGPHTDVTDDLREPRPSVTSRVLRFLRVSSVSVSICRRASLSLHADYTKARMAACLPALTHPFLPPPTASTFSLTPVLPSSLETLAGTSA
jgi:hypothetical protein